MNRQKRKGVESDVPFFLFLNTPPSRWVSLSLKMRLFFNSCDHYIFAIHDTNVNINWYHLSYTFSFISFISFTEFHNSQEYKITLKRIKNSLIEEYRSMIMRQLTCFNMHHLLCHSCPMHCIMAVSWFIVKGEFHDQLPVSYCTSWIKLEWHWMVP